MIEKKMPTCIVMGVFFEITSFVLSVIYFFGRFLHFGLKQVDSLHDIDGTDNQTLLKFITK